LFGGRGVAFRHENCLDGELNNVVQNCIVRGEALLGNLPSDGQRAAGQPDKVHTSSSFCKKKTPS